MKKITALALALIAVICVLGGCTADNTAANGAFDYKESYERLYKSVVEHGYAIDDLESSVVRKFEDGVCVCFGDSITGGFEPPNDYPTVIANRTGLTTVNAGFGGVRISSHPYPEIDAFCFYRLADAIATDDWTLQDENVSKLPLENSTARYNALRDVNWSEVDIITVALGSIDASGGAVIENTADPKDINTVKGALRYSIERIQSTYPHIKILVLTPIYRYWIDEQKDSDEMTFNGNSFIAYVDAVIDVAVEYKLPYVDLYRTLGFNSVNRLYYFDENDGTHPNAAGLTRMGERIANAINNEF